MQSQCRVPELAIVVPTFNEQENISELVGRIAQVLNGVDWEIIFVDDDSPDGTADTVRALARSDSRVRCLQRIGRRGLSSACIEGIMSTSAPLAAVMDADLQHDETLLPQMLEVIKREDLDIVIGSRYVEGGSIGSWGDGRARISRFATELGRKILKVELRDPMSGFFMLRRDSLARFVRNLSGVGFKILLDIFASSDRPLRFRELPFTFRERKAGESKLDGTVAWEYGMLLLEKTIGRYIPARFIAFSLVGGLGLLVHMSVLLVLFKGIQLDFGGSQILATLVAMVFNFFVNNLLTYRDMRLRGRQLISGLISFVLACSVGAIANVGVAVYLFQHQTFWALSAVAGVVVGAVWNYAVTKAYTWRKSGTSTV